jgi:hypothetical protein
MSGRFLISTKARVSLCPRCQGITICGVADGFNARADPYPVDRTMEAVAIVTSRQRYTLHQGTLIRREGHRLSGPVLVEHRCHQPLPGLPVPDIAPDPIETALLGRHHHDHRIP